MNVYEGKRTTRKVKLNGEDMDVAVCVISKNGKPVDIKKSQRVRHHSDEFEWGYGGSGPAQTALALLLEELGANSSPAARLYQAFKFKVVQWWPQDGGWRITGQEIREKIAEIEEERKGLTHA